MTLTRRGLEAPTYGWWGYTGSQARGLAAAPDSETGPCKHGPQATLG